MAYKRQVTIGVLCLCLVAAGRSRARAQQPGDGTRGAATISDAPKPQVAAQPQGSPEADPQKRQSQKPPEPAETSAGRQTDRILGVVPNYRAVSPDTSLPPLDAKGKFRLAVRDTFDYSSFVTVAGLSTLNYALKTSPELGSGPAGFGRYVWHGAVDQTVGNFLTEAIFPSILHEDPRYYTLGRNRGRVPRRVVWAFESLIVTKTDSGARTFNYSEVAGNAVAAGLSDLYYPASDRTVGHTLGNWAFQVAIDGLSNAIKEFWPDFRLKILHKSD